jgi:hypothetical protein
VRPTLSALALMSVKRQRSTELPWLPPSTPTATAPSLVKVQLRKAQRLAPRSCTLASAGTHVESSA